MDAGRFERLQEPARQAQRDDIAFPEPLAPARGEGQVAGGGLDFGDWLLLALVPVAGAGIALLTARMTVMASLGKMP